MKNDEKWIYVMQIDFKIRLMFQSVYISFFVIAVSFFVVASIVTPEYIVLCIGVYIYIMIILAFIQVGMRASLLELFWFRKIYIRGENIVTTLFFIKTTKNIKEIYKIKKKVLSIPANQRFLVPYNFFECKVSKVYVYSILFASDMAKDEKKENKELIYNRLWDITAANEADCQKIEKFIKEFWHRDIETVYAKRVVEKKNNWMGRWAIYWSSDSLGLDIISKYHRGKNFRDIISLILLALIFLIPFAVVLIGIILFA